MTPPRIVISHAYSRDNKGDAALLAVLIEDLRSTFPQADLTVLTLDDVHDGDEFEGVPLVPSFMHWALRPDRSRWGKLTASLVLIVGSLIWARVRRWTGLRLPLPVMLRQTMAAYDGADLVVGVGGGYLRGKPSATSTVELALLVHPLHVAQGLGVPTVLYNMSIGPFYGRIQRWLIRRGLATVEVVLARENITAQLVERLGSRVPVVRSIDSGFAFTSDQQVNLRAELALEPDRLLVGFTVRDWLHGPAQERYERAMAETADRLVEHTGAFVVFIPQVTSTRNDDDDRHPSRRVRELMRHQGSAVVWETSPSAHYVKAIFDELDLMVGTRFHSVIFALTSGVPAVAIEYEHKTRGIMDDLGLAHWVIAIEQVTAESLWLLVSDLVRDRATYAETLAELVPPYAARCELSQEALREALPTR